jgi:hypothetical protein
MATTQQMTQSGLPDAPRGMDLLDCPGLNKGTAFTGISQQRYVKLTLRKALADDAVSVIACPVDYSENIRLTDKLGKLVQPI